MKYILSFFLFCTLWVVPPSTLAAEQRGIAIKELEQGSGKKIGSYRALIIGINKYQDEKIPDLSTAVNDAKSVAKLLKKSYGFSDVTLLLDRQADSSSIVRTLRKLANSSREEDSVLIYYAGHGELDKLTKDGYWIPANATAQDPSTYIDNSVIQKYVKAIPARHVLLVADSCFSGSLFGSARAMPTIIDDKYYANLFREKSRWGMTSGNLTPVSDSGSAGHSVFAYQFLNSLTKNRKSYMTPREIYQNIAPIISNNSSQMPIAKPMRNANDQGGEFIFIRTDANLVPNVSATSPTQIAGADTATLDVTFWNSIKDSSNADMFQAYLDEFPDGTFAGIARIKLKQLSGSLAVQEDNYEFAMHSKTETAKPMVPDIEVLQTKTTDFWLSATDYANVSNELEFDVGLGSYMWGYGFAGTEIRNASTLRVTVTAPSHYEHHDENAFAGFIVDYYVKNRYVKRVMLGIGKLDRQRWGNDVPSWGHAKRPQVFTDLGRSDSYLIDLRKWSPKGWNGQIWFTVGIQNSGHNASIQAKVKAETK